MDKAMQFAVRAALAAIVAIVLAASGSSLAASGKGLLAETHTGKDVACSSCHGESPPAKSVATAKCRQCHGDFKTLAKKTEHTEPNPHASHQGDTDCAECHHVHKPSDDLCAKCHVTNWRVP